MEYRKGDWIKVNNDREAKEKLKELSEKGYGASRGSENYILVTAEPKRKGEE